MPGIENLAPDLTETSSGFMGLPNSLSAAISTFLSAARTWFHIPSGNRAAAA